MGTSNQYLDNARFIDMYVKLWRIALPFLGHPCTVGPMVAPTVASLSGPMVQVADHDGAGAPGSAEIVQLSAPLSVVLSDEFEGALASLKVTAEVLLLAALGRAVERTLGAGVVSVDIADGAHAGTVVTLRCASARDIDATATLLEAGRALILSSAHGAESLPEAVVSLSAAGTSPVDLTAVRALRLSACRRGGVLQLDWWYDSRRFDRYTVEELAEQFPLALIELTSEAVAPSDGSDHTQAGDWAFAG